MARKGERKVRFDPSKARHVLCLGPLCSPNGQTFRSPDPSCVRTCPRCVKYLAKRRAANPPGRPKMSYCQICSEKHQCSLVMCDTSHLHPKRKDQKHLPGSQGKALLSVCGGCRTEYGVSK